MDYRTYTAFIETRPLAIDFSTFDRLVRGEMRESQYTEAKALEQAAAWYDTAAEYYLPTGLDVARFAASHRPLCVAVVLLRRAHLDNFLGINADPGVFATS